MTKNKKGMSDIVVTLIIVLLSIVAIGIVWNVVKGLIDTQKEGISSGTKCLNTDVRATGVICNNGTTNKACTVTLTRSGSETGALTGVKIVFRGVNGTLPVVGTTSTQTGDVDPTAGKIVTIADIGIRNAIQVSSVQVTPYYTDEYGKPQDCSPSVKELA